MRENALDTSDMNTSGYALYTIEISHHLVGVDFNLDEIMSGNREFKGKAAGTHQWRAFREIVLVGKLKVDEGN